MSHLKTIKSYNLVNEINMYYEIHGEGKPLVLLHGGASTIQTSFGRIIPLLSQTRKLICIELQAHGRTEDRDTELSFEQDAKDVAELLKLLQIPIADIFGFSNGGNTAIQLAINHQHICNKVIAASILLKRNDAFDGFWEFMENGTFEQMPQQYKDAYRELNSNDDKLLNMYQKCANRMLNFKDVPDEQLASISCNVLLINASNDVSTNESIANVSRIIPKCSLQILPGGHGEYMGEITTLGDNHKDFTDFIEHINNFLN